jgi:hypothetical protein
LNKSCEVACFFRPDGISEQRAEAHRSLGLHQNAKSRDHHLALARSGAANGSEAETAAALRESFVVFTRVRFQHHAAQIEAGLDAGTIDLVSRRRAGAASYGRHSAAIARAGKRLNVYVRLGL